MSEAAQLIADLGYILPELTACAMAIVLLMVGAFRGNALTGPLTWVACATLVAVIYLTTQRDEAAVLLFHDMIQLSGLTLYAKWLVLLGALLTLLLSLEWLKREDCKRFEYPVLVLLAVTGLMLLISANDLLSLYMALELASLAMYVMASFERDNARSTEAGLKYFILGALASGMMLFGASLVYGFGGSTNFEVLGALLAESEQGMPSPGLIVGMVFVIVGFCFKISAVPFHMWTPDVYEGAPTPVVAFFAIAPKIAAIALFARFLMGPFEGLFAQWQQIVIAVSALSMLVGAFGALRQSNLKRLLAYSSIGHVGYALMGLAVGPQGMQATLIYLTLYLFMSVGAFGFVMLMARHEQPVEAIAELGGLSKHSPMMALFMALMMFSMAGIPPLAGFFGKFYVFMAVVDQELYMLAAIGLLSSVVAAYYYIKIVKVMYFDEAKAPFDAVLSFPTRCVLGLSAIVVGLFFLSPTPLISVTAIAAQALTM